MRVCLNRALALLLSAVSVIAGVQYETLREPRGPWVIHVVRVPRDGGRFGFESVHAAGKSVGLATVSAQLRQVTNAVAAINADFYERAGAYAGDPRGLQIVRGEMISAPNGSPAFWIDAAGEPRLAETQGAVQIARAGWRQAVGFNSYRETNGVVLYSPALGASTKTLNGTEVILSQPETLRAGQMFAARVTEIRRAGDSPLAPGTLVLSIGPGLGLPRGLTNGAELVISTMTIPNLRGVQTAISGGPILVRDRKRQRIAAPAKDSYEFSTMMERHPRAGLGWNGQFFFLVVVDGRQKGVSVGMTLEEFGALMARLGCAEALNLDGGGSSTLWHDGKTRNHLADRYEREVANALVVVEK